MINYLNQQLKFKNRSPPSPDYSKTPIINRARVTCTFTTTDNYCKVSMKSHEHFLRYGDDNTIYTIMNICSKFKVEAKRTSW